MRVGGHNRQNVLITSPIMRITVLVQIMIISYYRNPDILFCKKKQKKTSKLENFFFLLSVNFGT